MRAKIFHYLTSGKRVIIVGYDDRKRKLAVGHLMLDRAEQATEEPGTSEGTNTDRDVHQFGRCSDFLIARLLPSRRLSKTNLPL